MFIGLFVFVTMEGGGSQGRGFYKIFRMRRGTGDISGDGFNINT